MEAAVSPTAFFRIFETVVAFVFLRFVPKAGAKCIETFAAFRLQNAFIESEESRGW